MEVSCSTCKATRLWSRVEGILVISYAKGLPSQVWSTIKHYNKLFVESFVFLFPVDFVFETDIESHIYIYVYYKQFMTCDYKVYFLLP